MTAFITHPEAPDKDEASAAAEELADNLRTLYPEYLVRVGEHICSRFVVVVEVPFRTEHRPWLERQEGGSA